MEKYFFKKKNLTVLFNFQKKLKKKHMDQWSVWLIKIFKKTFGSVIHMALNTSNSIIYKISMPVPIIIFLKKFPTNN